MEFFASCPTGFEDALADELNALGLAQVRKLKGRVSFTGQVIDGERACLWSRLASRILVVIDRFDARDADALYAGTREIAWEEILAEGATIAVTNDPANETRALLLLAQEGLIELPADASAEKGVTTLDIVDAKGHDVQPLQADTVPAQLANSNPGTVAVINGNYALQAGLHASDALAIEDASGDAAQTYAKSDCSDEILERLEGRQSAELLKLYSL